MDDTSTSSSPMSTVISGSGRMGSGSPFPWRFPCHGRPRGGEGGARRVGSFRDGGRGGQDNEQPTCLAYVEWLHLFAPLTTTGKGTWTLVPVRVPYRMVANFVRLRQETLVFAKYEVCRSACQEAWPGTSLSTRSTNSRINQLRGKKIVQQQSHQSNKFSGGDQFSARNVYNQTRRGNKTRTKRLTTRCFHAFCRTPPPGTLNRKKTRNDIIKRHTDHRWTHTSW